MDTKNTEVDVRVTRHKKGWVLEAGFLMDFIKKNYSTDVHILDIGAGPGHWLLNLYENGYKNLHAVDVDNYIVFPEIKKLDFLKKADVSFDKLPFDDNSMDLVISMQVFEHLENPFHFEKECRRVLKPGGLLIMSYPYAWSLQSRLKFFLKGNVIGYRPENSHITFMTKDVFAKCFFKDFRIVREEYYRGKIGFFGKTFYLPATKNFGDGVCYFLEKKYFR